MSADLLAELERAAHAVGERHAGSLETLGEEDSARAALAALAESDLLGWAVPAAWGGHDARGLASQRDVSVRALCAARRALAWHSGMLDLMLVMQGLGSYALAAGESPFAERELPRVARGERIAAFALTEPGAGSSLGDVATRAERKGAAWRLDGRKSYISNAGVADFYTLLARTSGEVGRTKDADGAGCLTMFHVPADAAGLFTERFEVLAPHPIGEVVLEGVELPDEHRVGAVGSGLTIALGVLGRFRTSVAAAAAGFAARALHESLGHLASRRQFGKPLSSFQGLAFDVAEMDVRLRAAELLVDEAARAVDEGAPAVAEVARAKLFATEAASWICDRAVQHHGGAGVRRGSVVERLFRETRALRIYEGTSEIQRLVLARELFGR